MGVRPGFKCTEVSVFPQNWATGEVGDLNPFVTSGSRGWAKFYSDQGAPFVRITNMSRDSIYLDLSDLKLVNLPAGEREGTRTQLQTGDVLVSITADIGIIGFVDDSLPKPAYINQHIALVRFDPSKVSSRFVSYFLAGERSQKLFRDTTDVGAKAGMSLTGVRRLVLALPTTLAEQQAIAAALADVDSLLSALDKLIAKRRDLKQAAMQQLLTGPQRLPGFEGEWKVKCLSELCRSITDGTHFTPKYVDDGIPFYSVENVTADEFKNTKFIAPSEHQKLIKRCKPERGDLLLTRIGSIGETKLIEWDVNASIYVSLALLKVNGDVNARYLYSYTKCRQFVKDLEDRSLLNAAPRKINMGDIGDVPVPVPGPAEQDAIAAVLSDMDAEIAALKTRRDKTLLLKQGMMQELLTGRTRLV